MIAAEVMVPCMSLLPNCRLDWTALSAIGGWAAAIATFLAVYVPARNYKADNERRAKRERQVSFVEINRIIPKVRDIRGQVRTLQAKVVPAIPEVLRRGKADSAAVADLLRVKGQVPFVILSEGLEMISMAISNLQANLDTINDYLDAGAEIKLYENHQFHRMDAYQHALHNTEVAANNVFLAIKKYAGIDFIGEEQNGHVAHEPFSG
ncbi:hypothetical protein [Stenotrophomonas tuberculopleuritidis]|uniref:hypothetical protein n=1 Tax=Stenotrophomonas tuberculopleuritidis TaxID=3055079 RepID=UPI0026E51959|nr:hypothetical protein [Stenotrophomonas sp. 704A1]